MIEVKITGNSIPELADKLMAMGRALHVQASYEADNAAREALQAQRSNAQAAAIAAAVETAEKAGEIAAAKRSRKKAEQAAAAVAVVEDDPAVEAAPVADDLAVAPEGAAPALETVTAAVLSAVERVGRDKVVAILAQFGVNRASEVPAAQRAELLQMVRDA